MEGKHKREVHDCMLQQQLEQQQEEDRAYLSDAFVHIPDMFLVNKMWDPSSYLNINVIFFIVRHIFYFLYSKGRV